MKTTSFILLAMIQLTVLGVSASSRPIAGQEIRRIAPQGATGGRRIGLGFSPQEAEPSVRMVEPGSLSEGAGFRVGDIIASVNGRPLAEYGYELGALLSGPEPLVFVVRRGGEALTLRIAATEAGTAAPGRPAPPTPPFDSDEGDSVALEIADALEAGYLFPEQGRRYADLLREKVRNGDYRTSADAAVFASRVTADLNGLAEDRHLRVSPPEAPEAGSPESGSEPAAGASTLERVVRRGPGGTMPEPVTESGWLTDDVAFMRIGLMPPDPALKEWAARFMEEHAAAEALILDLRMCRGGTVDMMNGFLPYLYGEETHLLTMDRRPGPAEEVDDEMDLNSEMRPVENDEGVLRWHHVVTPSRVANKPDMPVYVLTGFTGSACEHLTMALKATGRATVIGSRTGGAGHFATLVDLPGGYSLMLPVGRTYDPRTGAGWEIIGIEPHIQIDPNQAEARALELFESTARNEEDPAGRPALGSPAELSGSAAVRRR